MLRLPQYVSDHTSRPSSHLPTLPSASTTLLPPMFDHDAFRAWNTPGAYSACLTKRQRRVMLPQMTDTNEAEHFLSYCYSAHASGRQIYVLDIAVALESH